MSNKKVIQELVKATLETEIIAPDSPKVESLADEYPDQYSTPGEYEQFQVDIGNEIGRQLKEKITTLDDFVSGADISQYRKTITNDPKVDCFVFEFDPTEDPEFDMSQSIMLDRKEYRVCFWGNTDGELILAEELNSPEYFGIYRWNERTSQYHADPSLYCTREAAAKSLGEQNYFVVCLDGDNYSPYWNVWYCPQTQIVSFQGDGITGDSFDLNKQYGIDPDMDTEDIVDELKEILVKDL